MLLCWGSTSCASSRCHFGQRSRCTRVRGQCLDRTSTEVRVAQGTQHERRGNGREYTFINNDSKRHRIDIFLKRKLHMLVHISHAVIFSFLKPTRRPATPLTLRRWLPRQTLQRGTHCRTLNGSATWYMLARLVSLRRKSNTRVQRL